MTRFSWTDQAKSELRQIDREQAPQILEALTHYSKTGQGDIKRLKGSSDLRLRIGDYRLHLTQRWGLRRGGCYSFRTCCRSANRKLPLLLPHELEQVDVPDLEMIADVWDLRSFWVA